MPFLSAIRRYRSQAASARPIMASSSLRQADPEASSTMAMILPHRAYAREVRGQGDQLARGALGEARAEQHGERQAAAYLRIKST
jgi:hypothetical protein